MKKKNIKHLLFLIVICSCKSLWATTDFFDNYSHYFSYKEKTFTTGLKVGLSMAEGRFAIDTNGNYNYGLSVFSDNYLKKFPIECQAGNISIGGIVSKLNNPLIDSSSSCFGGCYSEPAVITSSLPSYASFSKPFSTFIEAGWKNDFFLVEEAFINGTYTPKTNDLSFSSKIDFKFSENFYLVNTCGFSIFKLKENNEKSWYLNTPYNRESASFCFASQNELKLFNFSSTFSLFSYKSPFPDNDKVNLFENIYKTENRFENDNITICVSALFNNNRHLITRENKLLKPCTQLKTNIQYKNEFGEDKDYSIKAGFTVYGNINGMENYEDDLKIGAGTTFSFPLASVGIESCFSYKIPKKSGNIILRFVSANIENSWKIGFFSPTIGISSQYYISDYIPGENYDISENYKINMDFNFCNDMITNSNTFSFSLKNGEIGNKKVKTGINFNFSYKKLLISAKIAGEFRI